MLLHRNICFRPLRALILTLSCVLFLQSPVFAVQQNAPVIDPFDSDLLAHFHKESEQQQQAPSTQSVHKETIRLKVTGANFSCSEDECSHYHNGCALEIHYSVTSGNHTGLDIGASIVCSARVNYVTDHGYKLRSERCSPPVDYTLKRDSHIDSNVVLDFQFSPYEEVIEAHVGAIQCHIEDAELIHHSSTSQFPLRTAPSDLLVLQPH